MSQRIDLRLDAFATNERIVARNAAVVANPQQFAAMALEVLWIITAVGHEDRAITAERDPRRTGAGLRDKNIANFRERLSVPPSARQSVGRALALQRFRVGKIHEVVFGEAGMDNEIH